LRFKLFDLSTSFIILLKSEFEIKDIKGFQILFKKKTIYLSQYIYYCSRVWGQYYFFLNIKELYIYSASMH